MRTEILIFVSTDREVAQITDIGHSVNKKYLALDSGVIAFYEAFTAVFADRYISQFLSAHCLLGYYFSSLARITQDFKRHINLSFSHMFRSADISLTSVRRKIRRK